MQNGHARLWKSREGELGRDLMHSHWWSVLNTPTFLRVITDWKWVDNRFSVLWGGHFCHSRWYLSKKSLTIKKSVMVILARIVFLQNSLRVGGCLSQSVQHKRLFCLHLTPLPPLIVCHAEVGLLYLRTVLFLNFTMVCAWVEWKLRRAILHGFS